MQSVHSSPDVLDGGPLERVHLQHEHQEAGHRAVQVLRDVEHPAADFLEEGGHVLVIEGQRPAQQGVQDDAAAPDVHLGASVQSGGESSHEQNALAYCKHS